jgi:hypothetical protein
MTKSAGAGNVPRTQPTPASDDEKAAMKRALVSVEPKELFDRLLRENEASRINASLNRRKQRE